MLMMMIMMMIVLYTLQTKFLIAPVAHVVTDVSRLLRSSWRTRLLYSMRDTARMTFSCTKMHRLDSESWRDTSGIWALHWNKFPNRWHMITEDTLHRISQKRSQTSDHSQCQQQQQCKPTHPIFTFPSPIAFPFNHSHILSNYNGDAGAYNSRFVLQN